MNGKTGCPSICEILWHLHVYLFFIFLYYLFFFMWTPFINCAIIIRLLLPINLEYEITVCKEIWNLFMKFIHLEICVFKRNLVSVHVLPYASFTLQPVHIWHTLCSCSYSIWDRVCCMHISASALSTWNRWEFYCSMCTTHYSSICNI